ncbi:MAG: DUF4276 family protein [Chloroflexota bacterium]|nr:DUF4276 family protein [Chloroflexota bacterium]
MINLTLALYAEGVTDTGFLPVLIQRTVQQLLAERGRQTTDVSEPFVIDGNVHALPRQAERILAAARHAAGYHALLIHADADHPQPDRALRERVQPGIDLVQHSTEAVCRHLVPIVPVQTTEAWMLVDPDALRAVIGTAATNADLGLPYLHEIESIADPKQLLQQAVRIAEVHRRTRRKIVVSTIYRPLAERLSLQSLKRIPSYQQFVDDMLAVLIKLNLAQ